VIRQSIFLLAAFAASPAVAADISILNASFEDPMLADGDYTLGKVGPAWSPLGNAQNVGSANPTAGLFQNVPHGQNVAFVGSGVDGAPYSGAFEQVLTDSVTALTRYTLSVDVGRRGDGIDLADFVVELFVGDDVLASGTFGIDAIAAGAFKTLSFSYDALTGDSGQLGIRFRSSYNPGQGSAYRQTAFDNVRLETAAIAPVPEPASWAMMISGFGLAGGALRRRNAALLRFT
jgi:hypothetical protein